jgi:hypothetical protein
MNIIELTVAFLVKPATFDETRDMLSGSPAANATKMKIPNSWAPWLSIA